MHITTSIKYSPEEAIGKYSFAEVIFLLWRGKLPEKPEVQLLDAILVAAVEHGVAPPSAFIPRVVASTGNPMHVALASGMLAIGTRHGGAIQAAAEMLASPEKPADIVSAALAAKKPIPGLGHQVYKDVDPRAKAIYDQAKKLKLAGKFFAKAYAIEKEFKKQKGKHIPLNIDGAMAAGMLELKLDPKLAEAVFLLSRLVGMAAHVKEEQEQNNPYYRLES